MRRSLTLLFLPFLLAACIEPTEPTFQLEGPFLFVEGEVADQPGFSEVRVQRSNFREVQISFDPVTEATVVALETGAGTQVQWAAVEDLPGTYRPPTGFSASAGEQWLLQVSLTDGTEIVSEAETVPAPTRLNSVRLVYAEEGRFDEDRNGFLPVFRVLFDTEDAADRADYYQWNFRYWERVTICRTCEQGRFRDGKCVPDLDLIPRNRQDFDYQCPDEGCYQLRNSGLLNFATDQTFDGGTLRDNEVGDILFNRLGGLLVEGVQYGITPEAYAYGKVAQDLVRGNAGLNATVPAALNGNLRNLNVGELPVLGYVRAVSVTSSRVYLDRTADIGPFVNEEDEVNLEPSVGPFVPPRAPCEGEGRSPIRPEGWPE